MAGVRLEFAQFGHFDYFNIYRNPVPTDKESLGQPIGTSSTMYFEDFNAEPNLDYFYRVGVIRDSIEEFSEEIHVRTEVMFDPPYNLIVEFKNDEANSLELNWSLDGFVDEQRYYCSETPFDTNNPPAAKAVLAGDVRTYIDTDIEAEKIYHVCVGSVKDGAEKFSSEKRIVAKNLSNYFMDIDFNGTDGSTIYENVSNTVLTSTNASIQNNQGVFTGGGKVDVPALTLSGDFVISVDISMTTTIADYMNLFNQGALILRFGNSGFGYKLQVGINGSTLSGVYSCSLTQSDFVNVGVKNIKFSRKNGVCTLKVNDVVQNLGVSANPSSYPYTSFTDASTPELLNSRVGDGYVGKIDNFAILKS